MEEQKTQQIDAPVTDYSEKSTSKEKNGAKRKKKSFGRKILDRFLSDDPIGISERVKNEVIWPGIKKLGYEILMSGLSMAFWGEVRGGGSSRNDDYHDYSRYANGNRDNGRSGNRQRNNRPSYDYGEIIFDSESRAKDALGYLHYLVDTYGRATVADLLERAELSSSYTDRYYGWTDLPNTDVYSTQEGWVINLPPTIPIKTR